jgi:asparagine synthase (glutamine-hydrolysing)
VGLGMRRLKIIDLETGNQPIYNEDRRFCIVFNGEIYNFHELRSYLMRKGHAFTTTSDTEVIIHLYEDVGEKCLDRLRGMYAFAIWDDISKSLFVALDRIGIKPIYYAVIEGNFVFASELKSILSFPAVRRELDYTAMSDYFSFLYVPGPKTIFRSIHKLLPGHFLTIRDGVIRTEKYWDINFEETIYRDENECIDRFLELFEDTVRLHLISDVPLGAFLSGGVDSSLVVAMMARHSDRRIETFSIGYDGEGSYFDERFYSRIVARAFDTSHHEFVLRPQVRDLLERIVDQFDEPFADASALPNYILSRETRKYVTVALTGLGGDELCGGYERYLGCLIGEKYQKILPKILTERVFPWLVHRLPDSAKGQHFNERFKRFVNSGMHPFLLRYFEIVSCFSEKEKKSLFKNEILECLERGSDAIFKGYEAKSTMNSDILHTMSRIDLKTYLVDDLLTLTDRMSMAHSLEARVPFIDHKVVEFFTSVPTSLKIKGLTKKYLLKKAAERLLPKDVIYRKKMGFSVPLVVWFRNELRTYLDEVLSEERIRRLGFFNYSYIEEIKQRHAAGKSNYDEKLWSLITFVKWYERYM